MVLAGRCRSIPCEIILTQSCDSGFQRFEFLIKYCTVVYLLCICQVATVARNRQCTTREYYCPLVYRCCRLFCRL